MILFFKHFSDNYRLKKIDVFRCWLVFNRLKQKDLKKMPKGMKECLHVFELSLNNSFLGQHFDDFAS